MKQQYLNHKNIERLVIYLIMLIATLSLVYYLVYEIDWIKIYQDRDIGQQRNISVLNENCVKCHGNVTGFSKFHDPLKIGCSSCHLGNLAVTDKDSAHKGMIMIPGNSSDAKETCGKIGCHPGIPERIDSSIMSTMSGVISVDKYAFEEIGLPVGKYHIEKIGQSAAESHLRNLCASCHLGNQKTEFGPISELSRGGGCNACHLNYSKEASLELNGYDSLKIANPDSALLSFHPSLTLKVTNDHCFGCHSRSGRISTSYEGWHETDLSPDNVELSENYRLLLDGRVFRKISPDVHYKAGLVCADCHISYEVMGDGNFYEHKEEQLIVKCEDCHFSGKAKTITLEEFDYESKKIAKIKGLTDKNIRYLKTNKLNIPFLNSYLENGRKPKLIGKITNKKYDLNPPKFECIGSEVHTSLSCESCHTAWAPQCIGCHTNFEPGINGYDLLDNKDTDSTWVEYHGEYLAELPTLGVWENTENGLTKRIVDTFIPGMIMTLDKQNYSLNKEELIFKRLFAPANAHTIQSSSRSCESCHNSSLAIGYGRGTLEYIVNKGIGKWLFTPKFRKIEFDSLPEDAWVGFLSSSKVRNSTRVNSRPFDIEEQKKILTVGACLTCHNADSDLIKESLVNYKLLLKRISDQCILPTW